MTHQHQTTLASRGEAYNWPAGRIGCKETPSGGAIRTFFLEEDLHVSIVLVSLLSGLGFDVGTVTVVIVANLTKVPFLGVLSTLRYA